MNQFFRISCVATVGVATLVFAGTVWSQNTGDEQGGDDEVIEEVVVVAPRPGSRTTVDEVYEDPVRARLLKDLHDLEELEEETEWRNSVRVDSPSRIKWGYDPTDDYDKRNDLALQEANWETTKPATLFKVEF